MAGLQKRIEELEAKAYSSDMRAELLTSDNQKQQAEIEILEQQLRGSGRNPQQHIQQLQSTIFGQQQQLEDLQQQ